MAKKLVILCGGSQIEEEQFRRLLRELSAMGPMNSHDKQAILLATQRNVHQWDSYAFRRSLNDLLEVYWRTECSDPRDKVYALLGLVTDHDPARSLEVDYTITTQQLSDRILEKGYANANVLKRALGTPWSEILAEQLYNKFESERPRGYTDVDSEGLIVEITKTSAALDNLTSQSLFCTQYAANNRETWLTACDVKPGDTCYSFPGRKCSIIFRSFMFDIFDVSDECDDSICVGAACAFSSHSDHFSAYLKDLQSCLLKNFLFDGAELVITTNNKRPRYHVQAPSLLLSAVESYTSLLEEAERLEEGPNDSEKDLRKELFIARSLSQCSDS